jgi:hypothetical protein
MASRITVSSSSVDYFQYTFTLNFDGVNTENLYSWIANTPGNDELVQRFSFDTSNDKTWTVVDSKSNDFEHYKYKLQLLNCVWQYIERV